MYNVIVQNLRNCFRRTVPLHYAKGVWALGHTFTSLSHLCILSVTVV